MSITALGITEVAAITVICYLVGMIVKNSSIPDRWIPCFCGAFGCLLGMMWYLCGWPGFPGEDPVTAAAIGIVSGLAATGINQIYKQLAKEENNNL